MSGKGKRDGGQTYIQKSMIASLCNCEVSAITKRPFCPGRYTSQSVNESVEGSKSMHASGFNIIQGVRNRYSFQAIEPAAMYGVKFDQLREIFLLSRM